MTIYDIAKLAGVSASTVSRVVNGKSGMSENTRQKVQNLLDEYGFAVNEAARGLSNKETRLIGILVVDIRFTHYANIAYQIETKLREAGYCGIILNTGIEEEKKVESIRILEQRKVDGIILVSSAFQTETVKVTIERYFSEVPVIIANGFLDLPNVYGILVEEKQGLKNCVKLLEEKGYQKPAFIYPNCSPSNLAKREGFIEFLCENGWKEEEVWKYRIPTSWEEGYWVVDKILNEHSECDALIFAEDVAGVGAIRYLLDHGKKIPEEIAVIGVDDSEYARYSYPKMTTLDNKMLEMSERAAEILLQILQGETPAERCGHLFTEIIERETT